MYGLARSPSGVPRPIRSRNISPVEMCGTPRRLAIILACVPLPAPGGPIKIRARPNRRPLAPWPLCSAISAAPQLALLHKALVIAHHELRFDLLHGVHGHTDND